MSNSSWNVPKSIRCDVPQTRWIQKYKNCCRLYTSLLWLLVANWMSCRWLLICCLFLTLNFSHSGFNCLFHWLHSCLGLLVAHFIRFSCCFPFYPFFRHFQPLISTLNPLRASPALLVPLSLTHIRSIHFRMNYLILTFQTIRLIYRHHAMNAI